MKTIKFPRYLKLVWCIYLLVPFSCENCQNTCCGVTFEQEYTEIDSLTLTVGSIEIYEGNGYERNDFTTNKSTSFDDAAVSIEIYELKRLASLKMDAKPYFSFSLINQAFACSPPEPEPTQKLASITITSDQSITVDDLTYQSGEDLTGFFSIVSRYAGEEDESIEDFISRQNENLYWFGAYGTSMIFKLNTPVKLPEQKLTFRIELDDNSEFTLTTKEFIIE